jgi:hypothetical protein
VTPRPALLTELVVRQTKGVESLTTREGPSIEHKRDRRFSVGTDPAPILEPHPEIPMALAVGRFSVRAERRAPKCEGDGSLRRLRLLHVVRPLGSDEEAAVRPNISGRHERIPEKEGNGASLCLVRIGADCLAGHDDLAGVIPAAARKENHNDGQSDRTVRNPGAKSVHHHDDGMTLSHFLQTPESELEPTSMNEFGQGICRLLLASPR